MNRKQNKIGVLLSCLLVLTGWLFNACDDTMGGSTTPAPEFPADTLTFVKSPGDTAMVEFCASVNWKLYSDKNWCTTDGLVNTSGKSGKQQIPFVISDKNHKFVQDTAKISLWMNDEERVIAIVLRRPKGYFMELCGDGGVYVAGESITLGTSGSVSLSIKEANFSLDELRIHCPKWLNVTRSGADIKLEVAEDSLKCKINNLTDSLVFSNSDRTFSRSYHVQYVGMDPRDIRVETPLTLPLIVSRDAQRAMVGDVSMGMPVSFSVSALNDNYQVIKLSYNKNTGYSISPEEGLWVNVTDDNHGNIAVSVTEANKGKDRTVDLVALPKLLADSLNSAGADALLNFFCEEKISLKEDAKKYHLAQVTQDGEYDITISPAAQWGLKITADGKTYTTPTSISAGISFEAPVKATIDTYRGYQLLHVSSDSKIGCSIMSEDRSWLNVIDDKQGKIEVNFSRNTGNMRTAYLLALPLALVENTEDLSAELFTVLEEQNTGLLEIKPEAEQYLVAQFIQEADEESSMKVIDANGGWKYLTVEKETDGKWLNIAASKGLKAGKVFRANLRSGTSFLLNPLLAADDWNPEYEDSGHHIEVYGESGKKYVKDEDYTAEPTKMEEEGDYMLVQFKASYTLEEEYYIIYFVADNTYLKALVVWNYWE